MNRFKPEWAVNPREKQKNKPIYFFGQKVPTPANSALQCWAIAIFSFVGYHCYYTHFPIENYPYTNLLGIVCLFMAIYSLYMTWSSNPGSIPDKGWDLEDDSLVNSYGRPFCETCKKYKPERTHHCKVCDVCVLRMDHHCPFTDSCIGWINYKYYFALLAWANIAMGSFLIATYPAVSGMLWGEGENRVEFSWYLVLEYLAMIIGEGLIGALWISHIGFTMMDKTTIEWKETKHLGNLFSYWGKLSMWYTCLCRTLGNNPLLWIMPTRISIQGDGVNWHKPFFRKVPKGSKDDPEASKNQQETSSLDSNSNSKPTLSS